MGCEREGWGSFPWGQLPERHQGGHLLAGKEDGHLRFSRKQDRHKSLPSWSQHYHKERHTREVKYTVDGDKWQGGKEGTGRVSDVEILERVTKGPGLGRA